MGSYLYQQLRAKQNYHQTLADEVVRSDAGKGKLWGVFSPCNQAGLYVF